MVPCVEEVTVLPVVDDVVAKVGRAAADAVASPRILVAEDNVVNQKVIVAMLKKLGHRCVVADDGEQAVAHMRDRRYDLVLMDCQMPGVDGLEATARIRGIEGLDEVPIVALSAHAIETERARCLDAGMNDYLAKPISLQALRRTLARWMN